MAMNRSELLEQIINACGVHYDIHRRDEADLPLAAECVYHEHQTSYMVVKKAEMWSAHRHEYWYLFTLPHLTAETAQQCIDKTLELGEPQVKPGKNHMCTNLVCVILCDSADEEGLKLLKKCRIRKSFHFSLHGWMEVQAAAAVLGKETTAANAAGRNAEKFLKTVLHPKPRHRKFL